MGLVESHGNHGSHMTLQWGQWKPFRYCTEWQQASIATGSHRHTCSAREEPKSWWIGVESCSFSSKHRWLGLGLALPCACELNTSGKWIFWEFVHGALKLARLIKTQRPEGQKG